MKLVAASKMLGDIKRYEAAVPFGEIFTRLSTVPEDFEDSEETKSANKTTLVKSSQIHLPRRYILQIINAHKCPDHWEIQECTKFGFI